MKNKLLLILILIIFVQAKTFAIDIIYPKINGAKVYANSTFFVGNCDSNNNLYINSQQVEVLENGSFVKYVPLNMGRNTFFFEEKNKTSGELINSLDFKINRLEPPQNCIGEDNNLTCTDKIYFATIMKKKKKLQKKMKLQ